MLMGTSPGVHHVPYGTDEFDASPPYCRTSLLTQHGRRAWLTASLDYEARQEVEDPARVRSAEVIPRRLRSANLTGDPRGRMRVRQPWLLLAELRLLRSRRLQGSGTHPAGWPMSSSHPDVPLAAQALPPSPCRFRDQKNALIARTGRRWLAERTSAAHPPESSRGASRSVLALRALVARSACAFR